MSDTAWIALGGVALSALVAILGGIFNLLGKIGNRFNDVNERADARALAITTNLMTVYEKHEKQDQERHEENVQRLTRLETLVNGNGTHRRVR